MDIYKDSLEPPNKKSTVRILVDPEVSVIAKRIYTSFAVNECCKVSGHVRDAEKFICYGEEVIKELARLDALDNINTQRKDGRANRKYRFHSRAVGGPFAHKMFRYEKRIIDNEVIYTIWRMQ